jgi:hypothetical protein
MSSFTITGLEDMIARLERVGSGIGQGAARPLKKEAEAVMTDSKQNYVPVGATGNLRNSGYVGAPEVSQDVVSIEIGYGGAASAYAEAVHEHLSEHSPASWKKAETVHFTQGGPKYLELPLMAAERGMDERLGKGIEAEIERLAK